MLNRLNWKDGRACVRILGLSFVLALCSVCLSGCGGSTAAERPDSYGPAPGSDDAKMEGGSGGDTEESSEPLAAPG
ncbi:MAG: hypothetical protein ACE361_11195 [Aureliella sp.]